MTVRQPACMGPIIPGASRGQGQGPRGRAILRAAGVRCRLRLVTLAATLLVATPSSHAVSERGHAGRQEDRADVLVYFGTYTDAGSRGVYVSRLDPASGALSAPALAAETPNPSFLAVHPGGGFLYAANEIDDFEGRPEGSVTAFRIDRATGLLSRLNQQPSMGAGPAHLVVDAEGRHALVANYGGGSVAVLPIGPDGRLQPASGSVRHSGSSVHPERQERPHAHSINLSPDNRFAFAADLGTDKVMVYRFDAERGTLAPHDPAAVTTRPGAGPRHFAFHPGGRFAYLINELDSTITAFAYDPDDGRLTEVQTAPALPDGVAARPEYTTAEVQVHPSGRFLYGSNRGHDSIVVMAIDRATGRLTRTEHRSSEGRTPRAFGIDPSGRYLLVANRRSDSVVVFRIDAQTGRLTPTGHAVELSRPVCVKFAGPAA